MKYKVNLVFLLLASSLMLSACSTSKVSMEHIHGLGYSTDGKQIMIPAHTGLVVYSGSKWSHLDAPKNDYIGFVAVDNGFYSSGHPGVGSNLKNPIGKLIPFMYLMHNPIQK